MVAAYVDGEKHEELNELALRLAKLIALGKVVELRNENTGEPITTIRPRLDPLDRETILQVMKAWSAVKGESKLSEFWKVLNRLSD